jgi:hypothetical protein
LVPPTKSVSPSQRKFSPAPVVVHRTPPAIGVGAVSKADQGAKIEVSSELAAILKR